SDEVFVRLVITSDSGNPKQISKEVGLNCDRGWTQGDLIKGTTRHTRNHGWVLDSSLPSSASLAEQSTALLRRVEMVKDAIRCSSHYHSVTFSCVIYSNRRPAIIFENEVLRGITALGATLDVDVYIVGEDQP